MSVAESGKKAAKGTIKIIAERCNGCGYCTIFCPKGIIAMSESFNSRGHRYSMLAKEDECTGCEICALLCPPIAIEVYRFE